MTTHSGIKAAPTDAGEYIAAVFGADGVLSKTKPGYVPRPEQIELAHAVHQTFTDRRTLLAEAPTGCHVAGQLILMFDGRRVKVEDVEVGDELMGPDSRPRVVTALARGEQETVTIVPAKGEPWRVNLDHVLTLKRTNLQSRIRKARSDCRDGALVDVTVREYLGWSKTQKHIHKLVRAGLTYFKPLRGGRMDPYFLGVLLGDGGFTNTSVTVTTTSPEIRHACELQAELYGLALRVTKREGCEVLRFAGPVGVKRQPLFEDLRSVQLMGRGAATKRIPWRYKTNDAASRAALLAGLIDTDGSLSNGCFDYVSKSPQLADDVAFIARSLGLAAYVTTCRKRCANNDKWGTYYRVSISGDLTIVPVRLPHKRPTLRAQKKDVLVTGFKVEPSHKVERYYGFTLEGDGRYLLGDFTITHNTGKSLGYSVPASWFAAHQGKRVVLVTASIVLQEQLMNVDLPFLAEHLPWKFSFALAKGWSNYLCRDAMTDARNDHLRGRRLPVLQDQENLERAFKWADQTVDGDVSELPFELNATLKPMLTVSTEDCLRKACDHYLDCHARKAREALGTAQLLVANYHMYFTDLALRASSGKESGILPEHQLVVLDEGHKAATIARDFFGQRITPGAVRHVAAALDAKGKLTEKLGLPKQIDPELKNDLSFAADKLFAELGALRQDERRYKNRIDRAGMFDPSHLMALLDSARARYEQAAGGGNISGEGRVYLHARAARCEVLSATLRQAADNANAADWVYFLDDISGREGAVALMAVPFSVADVLRPVLFEREPEPAQGVVVTSATLCTSTGKSAFDFTASQLGAERADELVVASPFDFSRACLVIPRITAPTEDARAWLSDVCDQFVEATTMAGGRTLGLFTSYKALRAAKARLLGTRPSFTVLAQGDAPRTQLLQRFRDDETSVLLGCESFWEGVDAPGLTCSLVFIDRIPFDHFEDPIVDAIRARDRQWFMSYMVPRAITMFRQGFGRLVRSVTDGGVVVCCDTRLVDKAYGRQFLRTLPAGVASFRRLEQASGYLPTPF